MNLYPRSFLRLILLGWLLVALPLLVAIAYASLSLSALAERSEYALQQTSEATRLGWELEEDLGLMERILRQYAVLHDPSLLDDYAVAQAEWRTNANAFVRLPLLAPLADQVARMSRREADAYRRFETERGELKNLHAVLADNKRQATEIIAAIGRLTEAEREAFRAEAARRRQGLLAALAVALLLAGGMFWHGRRVIARLLQGVERAVIALGNNLLDRRIRLKGPDDLRWIGKRLDWLRRRMRALEEERSRILRHVSHELKTPLAALREGGSLLSEGIAGPLTPKQEKIAGIMKNNVARLQTLIDGLLKLQQAEHARARIELTAIRLDELIQRSLATHKLAARDKRLRVTGSLAPLAVAGGREETTAIVDNLLSNAIKFSPARGTVRISLTREHDYAVLDVTDEGPGVPEEDRSNIFEPFYRGPGTKSVAGVGLGLAIAKELATAQQGTLDLLPAERGAHFRARLPLAGEAA